MSKWFSSINCKLAIKYISQMFRNGFKTLKNYQHHTISCAHSCQYSNALNIRYRKMRLKVKDAQL